MSTFRSHGPRTVRPDLPLLETIISGGQTGTDVAALRAARALGLRTGGQAPLGFRTQDGPAPWLGTEFGLTQSFSPDYQPRTFHNVANSDVTVRIASDFLSPGEICTAKAMRKYRKMSLDLALKQVESRPLATGELLVKFLQYHRAKVVNFAGNAESTSKGIERVVEAFLTHVLGTR